MNNDNEDDFEEIVMKEIFEYFNVNSFPDGERSEFSREIMGDFKRLKGVEARIFSGDYRENQGQFVNCISNATNKNICAHSSKALNSHVIPRNDLSLVQDEKFKVLSLYTGIEMNFLYRRMNGLKTLTSESASSFYGFCEICENNFSVKNIDDLSKVDKGNFLLFFHRLLGRELVLSRAAVEKNSEFLKTLNKSTRDFMLWYKIENENMLDMINSLLVNNSYNNHLIECSFVQFFRDYSNIIEGTGDFSNMGWVTRLENYNMRVVTPDLLGFCCGGSIGLDYLIIEEQDKIEAHSFYVFWVDRVTKKQKLSIFEHKWVTPIRNEYSDNHVFGNVFANCLLAPRPNMYFSPLYNEKIDQCLDFLKHKYSSNISGVDLKENEYLSKCIFGILVT